MGLGVGSGVGVGVGLGVGDGVGSGVGVGLGVGDGVGSGVGVGLGVGLGVGDGVGLGVGVLVTSNEMCEMPLPVPPVVTTHVAGPSTGNELSGEQLTECPLRSFPDLTQIDSNVVPEATVNVTEFSASDVTVIPGAGFAGGFWPSHFPSLTGHVSV